MPLTGRPITIDPHLLSSLLTDPVDRPITFFCQRRSERPVTVLPLLTLPFSISGPAPWLHCQRHVDTRAGARRDVGHGDVLTSPQRTVIAGALLSRRLQRHGRLTPHRATDHPHRRHPHLRLLPLPVRLPRRTIAIHVLTPMAASPRLHSFGRCPHKRRRARSSHNPTVPSLRTATASTVVIPCHPISSHRSRSSTTKSRSRPGSRHAPSMP
jgi:hypothetical protein